MKVLPINTKFNTCTKKINKNAKTILNKPLLNPNCIKGSVGGLCAGGVLGYNFALFSFLIGITMSFGGAIASLLIGSTLGTFIGNKIEAKISSKSDK